MYGGRGTIDDIFPSQDSFPRNSSVKNKGSRGIEKGMQKNKQDKKAYGKKNFLMIASDFFQQ